MSRRKQATPESPRSAGAGEKVIGTRIRVRRVELGLSQQELGKICGVSFQQIQKYEKGINRVGAVRLEKLATALEVPVQFFFGGSGKEIEVESLIFGDPGHNIRLLRAYNAIESDEVRNSFVSLLERISRLNP